MYRDLKIIYWPDPRLRKMSKPITEFDEKLGALARRMLELMREHRGVGLAAPQVGENIRLFVMNPNPGADPKDDKVYVNPQLFDLEGEEENEEGCLSLPGINVKVWRSLNVKLRAQDLEGRGIEEAQSGYLPRIWQHEIDHLNGTLLTDRMGPVARLASRRTLKELEERYAADHKRPRVLGRV